MPPIITLTTDFGEVDSYVGEVKGALLARCPTAQLVDVTHRVAAGDIAAGAYLLSRIWERYPADTVHLCVIDPTVGTARKPIAARVAGRWFVGPDNGLVTDAARERAVSEAVELEPARLTEGPIAETFHGRDLFAPAAAELACGRPAPELGPRLAASRLVRLDRVPPERAPGAVRGHVLHVDRFGNLITDIPLSWLPTRPVAEIAGERICDVCSSFAAIPPGRLGMIRGSGGTLEISARDASAAERLGAGRDTPVTVRGSREER